MVSGGEQRAYGRGVPLLRADVQRCQAHVVAAQVEIRSKTSKRLILFQFQALNSRRFQRKFDRVNLHRPTMYVSARSSCDTRDSTR